MTAATREHAVNAEKMLNKSLCWLIRDIEAELRDEVLYFNIDLRMMTLRTERLFR